MRSSSGILPSAALSPPSTGWRSWSGTRCAEPDGSIARPSSASTRRGTRCSNRASRTSSRTNARSAGARLISWSLSSRAGRTRPSPSFPTALSRRATRTALQKLSALGGVLGQEPVWVVGRRGRADLVQSRRLLGGELDLRRLQVVPELVGGARSEPSRARGLAVAAVLPRQPSLSERAPRDDAQPMLEADGHELPLDLAREHVVLRLQGDRRRHAHVAGELDRPLQLPPREVRHADVAHLSGADERIEGEERLLDRCRGVPLMRLV